MLLDVDCGRRVGYLKVRKTNYEITIVGSHMELPILR